VWGGIHSFIIPVGPMGIRPVFGHVLSAHGPDVVVTACSRNAAVFDEFRDNSETVNGAESWTLADFLEHAPTLLTAFVLGVEIALSVSLPRLEVPNVTDLVRRRTAHVERSHDAIQAPRAHRRR
jgi:hypothetical protein